MNPAKHTPSDPIAVRILSALQYAAPEAVNDFRLDTLFGKHLPAAKRDRALAVLKNLGLVRCERSPSGGRLWFAVEQTAPETTEQSKTYGVGWRDLELDVRSVSYTSHRERELSIGSVKRGVKFHNGRFATADPELQRLVENSSGYVGGHITKDSPDAKVPREAIFAMMKRENPVIPIH
jgi:hypothetical protein